jgi:hypothetical protein
MVAPSTVAARAWAAALASVAGCNGTPAARGVIARMGGAAFHDAYVTVAALVEADRAEAEREEARRRIVLADERANLAAALARTPGIAEQHAAAVERLRGAEAVHAVAVASLAHLQQQQEQGQVLATPVPDAASAPAPAHALAGSPAGELLLAEAVLRAAAADREEAACSAALALARVQWAAAEVDAAQLQTPIAEAALASAVRAHAVLRADIAAAAAETAADAAKSVAAAVSGAQHEVPGSFLRTPRLPPPLPPPPFPGGL